MSQQPPWNNDPFVPPPPPVLNSLYSPEVLAAKEAEASRDAKHALIFSLIGLVCFGFIFGFLAFRKGNEAIETIDTYQVAKDKRGIAMVGKILGIIDIACWALLLLGRVFLR